MESGGIFMLKKLIKEENNSLSTTAAILAVTSLSSSVLGLARDRLLTARFGTGGILDSYFMAFKIPDLLYNFLILGTLSIAFIPVFTKYLAHNKKEEAWETTNSIINISFLVMGVTSLLLVIFTPFFVKIIAPGFSESKYSDTVQLMRLVAFSPLIFSISSIFTSILNSFKKFLIAALAPIIYNLGIIAGIIFFYPEFGITGLGIGVLIGALFHLLIQLPAVIKSGYQYYPAIKINEGLKKFWKMYLPKIFLIDISQVSLFIGSIIASTQEKAVSVFNLAYNLDSLPLGLFAISLVVAVFPKLSEMYAKDNIEEFKKQFNQTLLQILFLMLPISFMLIILRAQVVRLVYGTGRFNWEDTQLTLTTLGFFAVSLFAQGLIPLLNRAFYSRHNTKIPMAVGIGTMALNIILSVTLIKTYLGITALALAFSIASITHLFILGFILYYQLDGFDGRELTRSITKIVLASLVMAWIMQSVKNYVGVILKVDTFIDVFAHVVITGIFGTLVYLSVGMFLKLKQAEELVKYITTILLNRRSV